MNLKLKEEIIAIAKENNIDITTPSSIDFITDGGKEIDMFKFVEGLNFIRNRYMCRYRLLSEDFMDYFNYHLLWRYLSRRQPMSESFIRRNEDRILWSELINNPTIKTEMSVNRVFAEYIKQKEALEREKFVAERQINWRLPFRTS